MKKSEIAIVIPTIRNLDFLVSWKQEFKDCIGIIVEDHPNKEIKTPTKYFKKVFHYSWLDIDREMGKNSWIISRKNSGIRCFGFLKAWQINTDIIITLDDDCYPTSKKFIQSHLDNLNQKAPEKWFSTFPHPKYNFTRGFPYRVRDKYPVVMSHGLWSGALDLDAKTEKKFGRPNLPGYNLPLKQFVPFGYYFPMCVMNLAFTKEISPLMYMPLMGENNKGDNWGYDRFDDIWAGIFVKKILDHLKLSIVVGSPFIEHRKKSDIKKSFIKEAKGLEMNEQLWQQIDKIKLNSKTVKGTYLELCQKAPFPKTRYFKWLRRAIMTWLKYFK